MANSQRGSDNGGNDAPNEQQFASFWAGCSPEAVASFTAAASGSCDLNAGDDLFRSNEPCGAIFGLLSGWMVLYQILEDGRRQILHFVLPGAVLGFSPTGDAVMTYGAQALTDVSLWSITRTEFEQLCRRYPELGIRLATVLSRDHALAFEHLSNIGRRSARERVARLLLELFVRSRMRWPDQRMEELTIPLTQEHIGDATGLSGVHVNRVIRGLQRRGILEFHYRRLRILDPDKLLDVAAVDPRLALAWTGRE